MSNTSPQLSPSYSCVLTVLSGADKGKTYPLAGPGSYRIGRAKESHIVIDEGDKRASRNHAVVNIVGQQAVIDNLSQTNPTIINRKAVQHQVLKKGDRILVGATEFKVDFPGDGAAPPKQASKVKLIGIAVVAAVLLVFVLMQVSKKTPAPESYAPLKSAVGGDVSSEEDLLPEDPAGELSDMDAGIGLLEAGTRPSEIKTADEEAADAHFRKAMFFYDTGKLGRALDEIDLTLMSNRDHPTARKWLLRITDELNALIDTHYQNALVNKKFMRYRQAESDFRVVMELSRDKQDERYLDAEKQLIELGGLN